MKSEFMEKNNPKGLYTMLGESSVFNGNLTVPHSLRVDGQLKGNIEAGEVVTIGPNGLVEGNITSKSAIIGGKVLGNVMTEDRIELESKAVITGDISTRDLVITEGAVFTGNCRMDAAQKK
jgi:cytoskeletal protein CcmA (bactofilin family)